MLKIKLFLFKQKINAFRWCQWGSSLLGHRALGPINTSIYFSASLSVVGKKNIDKSF